MKSNTIRIDPPLSTELSALLKPKQSFASYVREVLRREVELHKMRESAKAYLELLKMDPDEAALHKEWEAADLALRPLQKRNPQGKTRSRKGARR